MNFDDAINAHVAWKTKLRAYIGKPDGSLDPAAVGADNNCALGKWLYGEGKAHAATAEHKALVAEHAKFHKAAAQIIVKAKSGKNVTEEVALGSSSEFAGASAKVISLIMEMKRKVG
jgi:hypothetical protein